MEILNNLWFGFGVALSPTNILYCFIGAVLGTVVGILPGISPLVAITMLLPVTFSLSPLASLIMLAGIYYGAQSSGSTTAIMLNIPGETSAVVTCLDGHPMAQQGRAGPALCVTALSSFFAGCVCIVIIALFSPPLVDAALLFQAPEYTSTVLLALVGASLLSRRSPPKAFAMAVLGVLLGTMGMDLNTGVMRFTFDDHRLAEGIDLVPLAIGLFAFTEVALHLGAKHQAASITNTTIRDLIPTSDDLRRSVMPTIRGTALGGVIGVIPGTGTLIASFCSYVVEKKVAKEPTRFGKGAIEGVAGPEAANNAAAFTHFIPMLALGIPGGATMALMLGALMVQGITPGPHVMTKHPDLFWGLIASMWVGNLMLLILNLPLVGIWIRLLQMPYRHLYPMILVFCCIGIYSVRQQPLDLMIAALVCVAGYALVKWDCEPASLIMGFVLGPILEENLRRSLIISRGDPTIFLYRPISLGLLLVGATLLVVFALTAIPRLSSQYSEE